MSTIVDTCGYCAARHQTLDVVACDPLADGVTIVLGARCRRCRMISCITAFSPSGSVNAALNALRRDDDATSAIFVRDQSPRVEDPKAPLHVPSSVAKAFVQAEHLSKSPEMSEPAAVMYGRTVESALEAVATMRGAPLAGGTLVKQIDNAAALQLIPKDLAEWAHEVRQLRNDGAHTGAVEHDEVLELQGFVELLLRYLFTLPGMMAERRTKKNRGGS